MRFSDALTRRADEIKRPANLPLGHYVFSVKKIDQGSVADGKWDTIDFTCTVISAQDDVDPDDLESFGKVAGDIQRKKFMFNTDQAEARSFEQTMVNLRTFLENCNIGFEASSEMTLGEGLSNVIGAQFIGELQHRPDKQNAEIVYTEIGRTAPL